VKLVTGLQFDGQSFNLYSAGDASFATACRQVFDLSFLFG